MDTLQSHVDPADPVFLSNRDRMQQLADELRERLARAREGGGAKYVERHRAQVVFVPEHGRSQVSRFVDEFILKPSQIFINYRLFQLL